MNSESNTQMTAAIVPFNIDNAVLKKAPGPQFKVQQEMKWKKLK